MRGKALVVGIERYDSFDPIPYARTDAAAITRRLAHHGTGGLNFEVQTLSDRVSRPVLMEACRNLFANSEGDDLVFYFSGHGYVSDAGGYLVVSEGAVDQYGVTLGELTTLAHRGRSRSITILLDCCHAGLAGDLPGESNQAAILRENMSIMAATLATQHALQSRIEGSLFTAALLAALDGAAANIAGEITISAIHSLVEKRFSLWQNQRPVLKAYVTRRLVLREVAPVIERRDLRRICVVFPTVDHQFVLDPHHDPERDVEGIARGTESPEKVAIGRLLKRYRDAMLVKACVDGEDFYYTAQRGHAVELTDIGKEYWRLVKENRV